jgi:hypothetical protein
MLALGFEFAPHGQSKGTLNFKQTVIVFSAHGNGLPLPVPEDTLWIVLDRICGAITIRGLARRSRLLLLRVQVMSGKLAA